MIIPKQTKNVKYKFIYIYMCARVYILYKIVIPGDLEESL